VDKCIEKVVRWIKSG